MDEFQINTIHYITDAKVEPVIANVLGCSKTLQKAINIYRSESPIRDINFNLIKSTPIN